MPASTGGCIPVGSVECGDGRFCRQGYYCGKADSCVRNGSIWCGTFSCSQGDRCGTLYCIPAGSVECQEGGLCRRGFHCSSTGCVRNDAVKCGNGYCDAGDECGAQNVCQPAGTAQRLDRVDRIKAQLGDLDSDIKLMIHHIGDASQDARDAERVLLEWIEKNEREREAAAAIAVAAIPELMKGQLVDLVHRHESPPNAARLTATLADCARKLDNAFRKIELTNGRFLWYAHVRLKGLREEDLARHGIDHGEYIHALGALAEAAIAFTPESFPKRLIGVGAADADIWSADFYAYWIAIAEALRVNRDWEIEERDLKRMAQWSGELRHEMEEKRQLLEECRQLQAPC